MILPRFPGIRAVSKAKSAVSEPDPENRLTLMGGLHAARKVEGLNLNGRRRWLGFRSARIFRPELI